MKLFLFWTGENEMSNARLQSVKSIEQKSGLEVILIRNKDVIGLVPDSYYNLSYVHRSDYLRCYFMHHYGGAYSDIKPCKRSWKPVLKLLEPQNIYAIGYPEVGAYGVAPVKNRQLYDEMKRNYRDLIGMGAFIFKKETPLTYKWFDEVGKLMMRKESQLKAHPGNERGTNEGYPIEWTELLGNILHPLVYDYSARIIKTDVIKPDFKTNYL